MRVLPNIIITGTPGVGKSAHSEQLARESGLRHLAISQLVIDSGCHSGWDDATESYTVDEAKVLRKVVPELERGGVIVDWHVCDIFPEELVDLVLVVRCQTSLLYDRLQARGYRAAKLDENMDAEIMQTVLDEARDSYDPRDVVELASNSDADLRGNVDRIREWMGQWTAARR